MRCEGGRLEAIKVQLDLYSEALTSSIEAIFREASGKQQRI